MATTAELSRTVLAAIVPGRRDLLEVARRRLTEEHFTDKALSSFFSVLLKYAEKTSGAVAPRKFLDNLNPSKGNSGVLSLLRETYDLLEETTASDDEFAFAVDALREDMATRATMTMLSESMEILRNGKADEHGTILEGHDAARAHILEALANIDRELTMQDSPEGAIQDEKANIIAEYLDAEAANADGVQRGIQFGIPTLDDKVGGLQRGSITMIAGASGSGKTTLTTQLAWSAAVEQGKNVVFFTTETLRSQVIRKLVSRHSVLPIFGCPEGLDNKLIKTGKLSDAHKKILPTVVSDLTGNPEYGQLYIAQVPRGSSISSLEARLARYQNDFDVDLVIMDYLALLVPERSRNSTREELAGILKEAKQVATTFNHGQGVPFVSPWQMNRAAQEKAEQSGEYTTAALSETAEAVNISDAIISLMVPSDHSGRYADVHLQVIKNRDGESGGAVQAQLDYATSKFSVNLMRARTSAPTTGGLDDLI